LPTEVDNGNDDMKKLFSRNFQKTRVGIGIYNYRLPVTFPNYITILKKAEHFGRFTTTTDATI
jgi:hypothetical protein